MEVKRCNVVNGKTKVQFFEIFVVITFWKMLTKLIESHRIFESFEILFLK